jgi:hypothetical protein
MEAFLLSLDVAVMILFLRNVLRVLKSGDPADLGIFAYSSPPLNKSSEESTKGVQPGA